MKAITYWFW